MWEYLIIASGAAGLLSILVFASRVQRLVVGGLYTIVAGPKEFGIVKLLAFDKIEVHICAYQSRFPKRPSSVDPQRLTLGTIHDRGTPGIGHTPILRKEFFRWYPILIGRRTVSEEDLEGYKIWKDSGGGYFNA